MCHDECLLRRLKAVSVPEGVVLRSDHVVVFVLRYAQIPCSNRFFVRFYDGENWKCNFGTPCKMLILSRALTHGFATYITDTATAICMGFCSRITCHTLLLALKYAHAVPLILVGGAESSSQNSLLRAEHQHWTSVTHFDPGELLDLHGLQLLRE